MSSLLYPPSPKHIDVDTFYDKIRNDPGSFTQFKVLRITHIKDLVSWVWHEYVQVIIRDISNGKLHRIIVERQTDNDYVNIGMWEPWTEGETPSSGVGDPSLPLPLFSLFFGEPLTLSDVANHIRAVRAVHKDYHLLRANCYWFALSLYTNLYATVGGTATEKKWTWSFFRGVIPTYITLLDTITRGPKMISAALFRKVDMLSNGVCVSVPMAEMKSLNLSDVDDIIDVSSTDVKEDSTTDTPASRLLTFTREIFKGETLEAEYKGPIVNFPSITDTGSDDFKAMLRLFEDGVSGDQSRTPYAEEVRTFCQEFLDDPAMKEHFENVSQSRFDEVFSPLKADNIPPECQEGLEKLGPGWCLSQDDCDKLNLVQKVTFNAVQKILAQG